MFILGPVYILICLALHNYSRLLIIWTNLKIVVVQWCVQ